MFPSRRIPLDKSGDNLGGVHHTNCILLAQMFDCQPMQSQLDVYKVQEENSQ
jgi:hypothetical protein